MSRRGGPVGPEEGRRILEALDAGKTTRQVAEEFKRAPSTISDVARRNGLDLAERSETKRAAIAKSCYAAEDRIKLIGRGLDKVATLLKSCDNARDLQALAMASAIWIDKRRLEDAANPTGRGGEIAELFQKMTAEEAGP